MYRLNRISIHAPRTGSDAKIRLSGTSTHISIHAPRTGSDAERETAVATDVDFNPRSPHGERPPLINSDLFNSTFQSTLPARGATIVLQMLLKLGTISIHAPRTGSDSWWCTSSRMG